MITTTTKESRVKHRGFASLPKKRRVAIARMGGIAAHKMGRAHEWTKEEAAAAGRIGGKISRRRPRYFREEL